MASATASTPVGRDAGDKSAYARLVDGHKEYAYTLAFRILNNREESEEVAQDAFLKAFGALDRFKGESRFSTWFYRIVFNAAVSQMRKRKDDIDMDYQEVMESQIAFDPQLLESSERRAYINKAVSDLPPQDAMVISLFYLKEFSLDEISKISGLKSNAVKVRLHRARARLADELRKILNHEVNSLL